MKTPRKKAQGPRKGAAGHGKEVGEIPTPPAPPRGPAIPSHLAASLTQSQLLVLEGLLAEGDRNTLARIMGQLDEQGRKDLASLLTTARPDLQAVVAPPKPPARPLSRPSGRQMQALKFMHRFMGEHGYPPAHKEIAQALKVHVGSVMRLLRPLAKKGYLTHGRRGEWALTEEAKVVLGGSDSLSAF